MFKLMRGREIGKKGDALAMIGKLVWYNERQVVRKFVWWRVRMMTGVILNVEPAEKLSVKRKRLVGIGV